MKKLEAIEYLVKNSVCNDEWSCTGMYEAIEDIVIHGNRGKKNENITKLYLDKLLKKAEKR